MQQGLSGETTPPPSGQPHLESLGAPTPPGIAQPIWYHLPGVQEEGEPQAVELVRHLGVEEGQEPTHVIHAVHLCRVACQHPLQPGRREGHSP